MRQDITEAHSMGLALEALEKIAKHEKECGERWGEVLVEIRELRKATDNHAKHWEKLAWLVVTSVVGGCFASIIAHLG
tara:strand:+ start:2854 stop:3087 length:234 start_codon:yes stop_codon:yes gene_type:complete